MKSYLTFSINHIYLLPKWCDSGALDNLVGTKKMHNFKPISSPESIPVRAH